MTCLCMKTSRLIKIKLNCISCVDIIVGGYIIYIELKYEKERVSCMFFFAFFGVQDKEKYIGTCNNIECPTCGRWARYEIYKRYSYFHFFFIPLFRWNVRYYAKTSCCGSIYELDPAVGREFEKNPGIEIRKENLRRINT